MTNSKEIFLVQQELCSTTYNLANKLQHNNQFIVLIVKKIHQSVRNYNDLITKNTASVST